MKTLELTPDVYKRIGELAENYSNVQAFVDLSLKNYLSKKATELTPIGWFCDRTYEIWYRDAAQVQSERCEALRHTNCGWIYKK